MSVRHAVLGLLHQRARHGYELHAALTSLGGGELWDVKAAQIYATLDRLAESGLVREQPGTQSGGPQRRPFELTDEGLVELRSWFSMPVKNAYQRDEFFLKLMLAITSAVEEPYAVLRTQRASLYRDLHELMGQRQDASARAALAHQLQLEQAVLHVEADLRWLERIEARLDDMSKQTTVDPAPKPRGRPRKPPQSPDGE
ncbi:MAG: PadR family transcriptional regulator [Myxococcales bacterium]|nr:PadR family transcriptional regulator [Myxococcales bacterium]